MSPVATPHFGHFSLENLARNAPLGCEVKWPNQVRVTICDVVQPEMADLYGNDGYMLPDSAFKGLPENEFQVIPVFATITSKTGPDQCTLLSLRVR